MCQGSFRLNESKNLITTRIRGEMYCQQIFQNLLGRRCSPNIRAMSSEKLSTPREVKRSIIATNKKNHYRRSIRCRRVRSRRWQAMEIHRDIDRWYSEHRGHPADRDASKTTSIIHVRSREILPVWPSIDREGRRLRRYKIGRWWPSSVYSNKSWIHR